MVRNFESSTANLALQISTKALAQSGTVHPLNDEQTEILGRLTCYRDLSSHSGVMPEPCRAHCMGGRPSHYWQQGDIRH
jgi:hypothetical protein